MARARPPGGIAIKPWVCELKGSKTAILAAVEHADAPDCAKRAVVAIMEPMAELPGFTDEDPADIWAREVPHTAADIPPKKRSERLRTFWRVTFSGHPEAHGTSEVRVEGVYEAKVK